MKTFVVRLFLPAVAVLGLSSCVDPMYGGAAVGASYGGPAVVGYQTYTTLPPRYSGNAYYYNGRYYSGGRYETGAYSYQGRPYSNRYFYNGQYYYGGTHRNYGSPVSTRSYAPTSTRPSYDSSRRDGSWDGRRDGDRDGDRRDYDRSRDYDRDRDGRSGDDRYRRSGSSSSSYQRGPGADVNANVRTGGLLRPLGL